MTPLLACIAGLDADVDRCASPGATDAVRARRSGSPAGAAPARPVARRRPRRRPCRAEELAGIDVEDDVRLPGCGPVAFGSLPFAGSAERAGGPGRRRRSRGRRHPLGHDDHPTRTCRRYRCHGVAYRRKFDGGRPLASARRFTVTAQREPDDWCALVERATKAMTGGTLHKVVLARQIDIDADHPIDRLAVLERLRSAYPGCHVVSVDGFVAASPELLVSVTGDIVRSHPMAGTAPRRRPTTDQRLAASLLASAKDRQEHQITIDMVHDTLLPWCSYLDYEAEPSVVAVANVQHLATLVEGRLSQPAPSVLELVAALHPTPAVAGWPRDEAVEWIEENEGFDRRRYAGTAGWVDAAAGNGTWAVSIRCAEIDGPAAGLGGNGIVADSDPSTELAETRSKLQALLSAIVRP